MGAKNRVGIGLSYRPARLHRLAELLIPWNQFLGFFKVKKSGLWIRFMSFPQGERKKMIDPIRGLLKKI
jgi:hypothetical protein